MKIPVSAIVVTQNEEKKIRTCLEALKDFSEVIVVDSQSRDATIALAQAQGAKIINFIWNKQYPKKRQWCLDHLALEHEWVLFVDADEIVTPELILELKKLFERSPEHAGYFIKARYIMDGQLLRFGLQNNKLALLNRRKLEFPVVDDLDIPGMGEMEGHYQPVLKPGCSGENIGKLKAFMIHDTLDDTHAWVFRHNKYARWEEGMNAKNAWPDDPQVVRNKLKKLLRNTRFKPELMFFISYVLLGGFLDGNKGLKFAKKKKEYYASIK